MAFFCRTYNCACRFNLWCNNSDDAILPLASFLVKKLFNFLDEEARFFDQVEDKVSEMQSELWTMGCFLIDAERKQNEGDVSVSGLMVEITELLYEAEEIFATFLTSIISEDRTGCYDLKRCLRYPQLNDLFVRTSSPSDVLGARIQQINNSITSVTSNLQACGVQESLAAAAPRTSTTTETAPPRITDDSTVVEDDVVVGLQDHITTVVAHLKDKTHPDIIIIWGIAGVGKTTFSKENLHHIEVKRYFDRIAWVCVSQECNPNQIWRDILFQFADQSEEEKKMIRYLPSDELAVRLRYLLMQKRCLVILDDMWKKEDWMRLDRAFPFVGSDCGSKILITTRQKEVLDSNSGFLFSLYELQPLTKEESLVLLEKKAWSEGQGREMKTAMKKILVDIVGRCGGLPLAIVLIGGLLAKDKTLEGWQKVLKDVSNSLNKGNEGIKNVLALSYLDLPCHLKACFLYLSLFPEDCEIEAKSLVQMWIAEGFVSVPRYRSSTKLSVGLTYLNELVNRSMVQANIARFTGRVRSCRLHDVMRDFCLSKARDEKLSEDLHLRHSRPRDPTSVNVIHRLAVYLDGNQQRRGVSIIPLQQCRNVLSCLVHPPGDYANVSLDMVNSLLKGFRILKVFSLEHSGSTDHGKISEDIGKLVHLRYLKLALSGLRLPASLGNLIFLQTLDLRGIECTIPDVLWKLVQLRHLYLPRYYSWQPSKLHLDGLIRLETLVNFRTDFCDIRSLEKLTNLRKVSIGCRVDELATIFDLLIFRKVSHRLLKLNLNIEGLNIEGAATEEEHGILSQVLASSYLSKLTLNGPLYQEISFLDSLNRQITSINLTGCQLTEDPMPVLGKMPHLRKLILRHGSYIGKKMVCIAPNDETAETSSSAGGFPQLTLLWLKGLDISEWEVEKGTMPCLSTLGIYSCNQLKELPDGLKYITTLERLFFADLKPSFERRILQGGKDFHKVEHVPFMKIAD